MAATVTMMGCFSMEERDQLRSEITKYFQERAIKIKTQSSWEPEVSSSKHKKRKSPFFQVLKDIGFAEQLKKFARPSVLTHNDSYEVIFCILFAPSCPVIIDPTGEVEKFVKEEFISSIGAESISAADIAGNGKLENCLMSDRAAILKDVNFSNSINGGMSIDLQTFRRLSGTIFNGFDFHDVRTA